VYYSDKCNSGVNFWGKFDKFRYGNYISQRGIRGIILFHDALYYVRLFPDEANVNWKLNQPHNGRHLPIITYRTHIKIWEGENKVVTNSRSIAGQIICVLCLVCGATSLWGQLQLFTMQVNLNRGPLSHLFGPCVWWLMHHFSSA
jgi:hypothetical protein